MAPGADAAFLDRVRGLLSPDGLLVLTVPYGTRAVTELERIYDEESLSELLGGWEILERRVAVRTRSAGLGDRQGRRAGRAGGRHGDRFARARRLI